MPTPADDYFASEVGARGGGVIWICELLEGFCGFCGSFVIRIQCYPFVLFVFPVFFHLFFFLFPQYLFPFYLTILTIQDPIVFLPCPLPNACINSGTCAEGYEGGLCAACSTGYYKRSLSCKKCSEKWERGGISTKA